jgi:hypothetical protein
MRDRGLGELRNTRVRNQIYVRTATRICPPNNNKRDAPLSPMVSKRRQEELEDSEEDDIETLNGEDERGTPLKRARTEGPEGEDEGPNMRVDVDETITDAELERMHEAAINEKLSQKASKAGVSNDAFRRGVSTEVTLKRTSHCRRLRNSASFNRLI